MFSKDSVLFHCLSKNMFEGRLIDWLQIFYVKFTIFHTCNTFSTQVGWSFLINDRNHNIPSHTYIKVDNNISNQVKHRHIHAILYLHIEYVTHTHVWWSGSESERRCRLLFMFNQTPHDDEWYSSLILVNNWMTYVLWYVFT